MIKMITGNVGIGEEVRPRDYSVPLESQRELAAYGTNILYPVDFGLENVDIRNLPMYENQLIRIWRAMAENPYIDFAIDDIVNEMISYSDDHRYPILLNLNTTRFGKKIQKKFHEEWLRVMKLLQFDKKAYALLKDWYVDGKQYFYYELYDPDKDNGKTGIKKVIQLDPVRTKLSFDEELNEECYIFKDIELKNVLLKIPKDSIIEVDSGLMDRFHQIWISYLNKAYIPLNQLNSLEDAALIYKIARAPERRVFYIDVGQLPKSKAETYMKEVIRNCRNKVEYDPSTGKLKESALHMSLLDDIYLPRSADGRATEVSTMQGGNASIGNMEDLDYFKMKLFRSLNVPFSRWIEMDNGAQSLGRTSEITRDELKYRKFIVRLRQCYELLFYKLLKIQLKAKNIVSYKEFEEESDNIQFIWISDSMYAEFRDLEILQARIDALGSVENYLGQYYSISWARRNILKQTDEDIRRLDAEIEEEKKSGEMEDYGDEENESAVPEQKPAKTEPAPEEPEREESVLLSERLAHKPR